MGTILRRRARNSNAAELAGIPLSQKTLLVLTLWNIRTTAPRGRKRLMR